MNNEHEAVMDFENAVANGETFEVPIAGMDSATFERVYEEFFADEIRDQYGVKNEILKKIPTKTVSTEKKENDCAICMVPYKSEYLNIQAWRKGFPTWLQASLPFRLRSIVVRKGILLPSMQARYQLINGE